MESKREYTCGVEKKCGACQLSNMDYPRQLSFKQAKLIKLLGRFGHVSEIIGMESPYHYRSKAQFAVRRAQGGRIVTGVYQSATGGIAVTDSCFLNSVRANEICAYIRKQMHDLSIAPFDPKSGRGVLRHIMIRNSVTTGEYMVVLVCFEDSLKNESELVKRLVKRFPEIKSVVLSVSRSTKMTLGAKERVLSGRGYIEDIICGKRFRLSPRSFCQVNPVQTEILYSKASEFAALEGHERILDAYCGVGTIGICAAGNAASIVGVEINPDAVNDARENARLNGMKNAVYHAADAAEYMLRAARDAERFDVVFTDPPRAGCSREFLSSLVKLMPKKVVYISCSPETLARDLWYLTKNGYKAAKIRPVDMFPGTAHVECVVLLNKVHN